MKIQRLELAMLSQCGGVDVTTKTTGKRISRDPTLVTGLLKISGRLHGRLRPVEN